MLTLPFENGAFDLVMSMWQSVGYFETERENSRVFLEISRVLGKGGIFILQINNPLRAIIDLVTLGHIDSDGRLTFEKIEETQEGVVTKSVIFDPKEFRYKSKRSYFFRGKQSEATHDMRYYTLPELRRLFLEVNISVDKVFGSMNGEPYSLLSKEEVVFGTKY